MESLVRAILEMVKNKSIDSNTAIVLINELKKAIENEPEKNVCKAKYKEPKKEYGKIAVIGMALKLPMADTPEEFWNNLINSKDCITEIPSSRFSLDTFYAPQKGVSGMSYSKWGGFINNVDKFATSFFKIDKEEAKYIDPQQRIFLELALEAFHRAGYSRKKLSNSKTSVIVGARSSTYYASDNNTEHDYPKNLTGNITNFIAARVSDFFNLKGPSFAIDTACSSSLVAIHYACKMLNEGECNMAIAGGIDLKLTPLPYLTLSNSKALSMNGKCYSFDKRADGFVPGEGAGVVILKPFEKAVEDGDKIYGVITGSSVNNDGHTMGITTPNYDGQKDVIREAIKVADVNPSTISYIEAHGTGTTIGDPIEIKALTEVFREYSNRNGFCGIGSVKTNIGHLDTAAGIAGFIKVVLSLYHKKIVPTLNCDIPNPRLNLLTSPFYPTVKLCDWAPIEKVRRAGVSSFGFGGTNCHMILEEYTPNIKEEIDMERKEHILILSAENSNNVKKLANLYRCELKNNKFNKLDNFIYTANTARENLNYRAAICVKDIDDTIYKLETIVEKKLSTNLKDKIYINDVSSIKPSIAMVFPGQGSQYIYMARKLYNNIPVFKKSLDECDVIASEFLGKSLIDIIYKKENENLINETAYTQPVLFSISYSLAQMWIKSGIKPKVVLGHSIGEYVAACISGIFTLEDAIKLVCARGHLIQELPQNGGMVILFLEYDKTLDLLRELPQKHQKLLSIAAINSPFNTVISGDLLAIEKLLDLLREKSIKYRKLKVSHGFHSVLMEPMVEEFGHILDDIEFNPIKIPLILNMNGKFMRKGTINKEYWQRHVKETVMFNKSINTAINDGINIFLEVGPSTTVSTMIKDILGKREDIHIISTLDRNKEDITSLNTAFGQLFTLGVNLDFEFFVKKKVNKELIPVCPLEKESCWIEQLKRDENAWRNLDDNETIEIIHKLNPLLKDHVVKDINVFPGAALWEFVIRSATEKFRKSVCSLNTVKHMAQLELKEGESLELKIVYNNKDNYSFKVMSKSDFEDMWKLNASGIIEFGKNNEENLDIENMIGKLHEVNLSPNDIYTKFKNKGISYGEAFRSIKKIWSNDNSVIAKLSGSHIKELNNKDYLYNPGIIDGALQSIIGLKETEGSEKEAYIPFIVGEVSVKGQIPNECYSYLKVVKNINNILTVDIAITDMLGNIKMNIKGHSFKKLNSKINLKHDVESRLSGFYYMPKYVEKQCLGANKKDDFSVIILCNKCDFNDDITLGFKNNNIDVIWCINEEGFKEKHKNIIEMDISSINSFKILFNRLHSEGIEHLKIVNLLPNIKINNLNNETEVYFNQVENSLINITRLVQSIQRYNKSKNIEIVTVSRYFLDINNIFETPKAVISGFIKSVAKECSNLKLKLLDIDTEDNLEFCNIMVRELKYESNELIIHYERNKRFTEQLEKVSVSQPLVKYNYIKANGTYIITGGLNGIGFSIAKIISKKYGANLILIGRSKFPNRNEWDSYLNDMDSNKGVVSKIRDIKSMESNGSKITICNLDVTDKKRLEELKASLGDDFKIDGIFHLAGVIRDSLITNKNVNDIKTVLNPKVLGAINLVETFKDRINSFIVFFSSIASFFGSVGQCDYAAANSFMDYYAKYITSNLGIRAISINWTLWEGVGMGEYSGQAIAQRDFGIKPFDVESGYKALEYIMELNLSQVIALNNPIEEISTSTVKKSLKSKESINEKLETKEKHYENDDNIDFNFIVEDEITSKIADILQIEKKNIINDVNFMELGLDSVTIVDFTSWIGERLKIELYPTLLFEYSTIKDLSQYLVDEYLKNIKCISNEIVKERNKPLEIFKEEVIEAFQKEDILNEEEITTSEFLIDKNYDIKVKNTFGVKSNDIAIIGFSGMFPGAENVDEYWNNLKKGVNCVTTLESERINGRDPNNNIWGGFLKNPEYFDSLFFNISPKEAVFMDPQQRIFLENAWMTLDMAGYGTNKLKDKTVGVYVGASQVEYKNLCEKSHITSPYMGLGNSLCLIANRVSYLLNLRGPSVTIDSACSSSLVALDIACSAILNNQVDMAIAGGVQLYFTTDSFKVFKTAGMLSSDGKCKTFDEKADGYVRGEGVGAILLKPLNKAVKDGDNIYAVIKGIAVNHDGNDKVGISAPNPNSQKEVILKAIEKAEISPEDISHVEAHGTGTSLGDPVEIRGLTQAYKKYTSKKSFCAISTAKSLIGHLEAAAGIAGVIKTILMFKNNRIPPTINFNKRNPNIPFHDTPFYVNDKLCSWNTESEVKYASVSSFGFGGTNCHVILSNYVDGREYSTRYNDTERFILTISAKTASSLNRIIRDLRDFIIKNPDTRIGDICFSINTGRDDYDYRACFIVNSISNLKDKLDNALLKGIEGVSNYFNVFYGVSDKGSNQRLALVIGNLNKTDINILKEIKEEDKFNILDDINKLIVKLTGNTIENILESKNYQYAHRIISFIAVYINIKNLNLLGIEPVKYIAYRSQLLLAATLAGIVSLEDALIRLINENYSLINISSKKIDVIEDMDCNKIETLNLYLTNARVDKVAVIGDEDSFISTDSKEALKLKFSVMDISSLSLLKSLGLVFLTGLDIDWINYYNASDYRRIVLPTYPFEKRKYLISDLIDSSKYSNDKKMVWENKDILENNLVEGSYKNNLYKVIKAEDKNYLYTNKDIKNFLKSIISKLLSINEDELDISLNFSNFGLDSLIIGDAVNALEEYLGQSIPHSLFMEYPSINKLSEHLFNKYNKKSVATEIENNPKELDIKNERMKILNNLSKGLIDKKSALEQLVKL